jgi:predicted nuclease with TOPRIM domain
LVERTETLEHTTGELQERTDELVQTRQTLVERTETLEHTTGELQQRTDELDSYLSAPVYRRIFIKRIK